MERQVREPDRYRGSAASRGYDSKWRTFRAGYLRRHPLCVDCESVGHVAMARHVHHIKKLAEHPRLKYAESNLMPLCEEHHNARTARGE
ncbi:MAG TPA: HNH endonuclease signature motif containing protein [Acidisarcina sp.]|nr:HNH endonuclease signature motif containing protein [Acidisarcina sp.]